jgi:hypothetical protein
MVFMRARLSCGAALAAALLLSACGESSNNPSFSTRGLSAPISHCTVNPRTVAVAERVDDIDGRSSCGVDNAWRVREMAGVGFSQPALVNCGMIGPLNSWMSNAVQPAAEDVFGERVTSITIASSYSCRPRNNRRGAKMSEHGFGNAIDISGFTLESGRTVEVKQGYFSFGREKSFLKQVRREACGDFSTVLGPGSDRHHNDHLHLDMANRRSKYCT